MSWLTGESTVGRDEECQVPIPVRVLSRQHAILLVEGGEHFVQDLGSQNNTYRKGVSGRVCVEEREGGRGRKRAGEREGGREGEREAGEEGGGEGGMGRGRGRE